MPTYESLPAESTFFNGNLFQKMVDDLRLDGKAKRTVYGYLRAVRKLADFCRKSPEQICEQDVRRYLLRLIVELEVATGTQTVALSGIKFCFRTTCPRDWKVLSQTRLRYIDALPEVITRQQVCQFIDTCRTGRRVSALRTQRKNNAKRTRTLGLYAEDRCNVHRSLPAIRVSTPRPNQKLVAIRSHSPFIRTPAGTKSHAINPRNHCARKSLRAA